MAAKYTLGDFLKDINWEKKNILRHDIDAEKDYNPYITNMVLSYHPDCVAIVNELNCRPNMSKKMQYDFLIQLVRRKKRFAKRAPIPKSDNVKLLMDYYDYSETRAHDALYYMSDKLINEIKLKSNKGGL